MASLYTSEKEKKAILALYDEKLTALAVPHQYQTIETSYGNTNIIVSGNLSSPPIVLLHGSNGCAPIAIETYPNLYKSFRVYAIDVLAQPNKSAETRLRMNDDSYGKWMHEIIDGLDLENVRLAGFSFGGLIILKTLEYSESKIKEVYLSAPAYIVNGNPFKLLLHVFLPMKRYKKTKNIKHVEKFLSKVFTDRDAFAINYLSKVFLHFNMDFTPVPVIKSKKAKAIKTPITLFAADKDLIFPGNKMIKRALAIFPSLKGHYLIKDSKHVQNSQQNTFIEQQILNS